MKSVLFTLVPVLAVLAAMAPTSSAFAAGSMSPAEREIYTAAGAEINTAAQAIAKACGNPSFSGSFDFFGRGDLLKGATVASLTGPCKEAIQGIAQECSKNKDFAAKVVKGPKTSVQCRLIEKKKHAIVNGSQISIAYPADSKDLGGWIIGALKPVL
jgi:hypothetical protein